MTDEQGILLSSIFDAVREIRDWQKAQTLRIDFLYAQSAKHEEAIVTLKERADGLHAKQVKMDNILRGPLPLKRGYSLPPSTPEHSSLWFRLGMFIVENKAAVAWMTFFGLGSLISLYNLLVNMLHHLPILPMPTAPGGLK